MQKPIEGRSILTFFPAISLPKVAVCCTTILRVIGKAIATTTVGATVAKPVLGLFYYVHGFSAETLTTYIRTPVMYVV